MKVISTFFLFLSLYAIESAKLPVSEVTTESTVNGTTTLNKVSARGLGLSATTEAAVTPKLKSDATTVATTSKPPAISTTTRKAQPPKKYTPATIKNTSNGPTKISLTKTNAIAPSVELTCPKESEARFNLFAPPCSTDRDCTVWNKEERCCKLFGSKNCIQGVPKPPVEPKHNPFLGIPRKCPQRPLAELWWDVKDCETDDDCWPRICCPDGYKKFCRAPSIEYSAVPFSFGRPMAYFSEYLECTPPPPQVFDLHPKPCNSTFDCFPNVCCQEAGKRHCRPPKKSVLPLMANFLNAGVLRRLTNNFVIR